MKIYLVRHGQTAWNQQCRYQGSQDIPLDEVGISQVLRVASRLKEINWHGVISSDLIRTKQTAQMILDEASSALETHYLPELREMHFGDWEGITFTEAEEKWPDKAQAFFEDPTAPIIPNGENATQFRERVMKGFEQILELGKDGENWLVATHGGTIRVILCELLGTPLKKMWEMHQGNTAINILSVNNGKIEIEMMNDTTHLEG